MEDKEFIRGMATMVNMLKTALSDRIEISSMDPAVEGYAIRSVVGLGAVAINLDKIEQIFSSREISG